MSKATFQNLPAEKRDRFLSLAIEEFAAHDYAGASISKLVGRAGIAKGSLYQYFEDKADLFVFLVEHAQNVLLETVREEAVAAGNGPSSDHWLDLLRAQMSATVRAALRYPLESQLVQRAYQAPAPIRRRLEGHDAGVRLAHMQALLAQAQSRGELAPERDVEVAAHVLAGVMSGLGPLVMKRLGLDPALDVSVSAERLDPARLEPIFDEVLQIVSLGLGLPRKRRTGRARTH